VSPIIVLQEHPELPWPTAAPERSALISRRGIRDRASVDEHNIIDLLDCSASWLRPWIT
jgi:hypothetical protein